MASVDIEVNGRAYRLICEPGQENRIRDLGGYVEGRLKALTGGGRSGSDAHMLLATCLVLADELQEVVSGREILSSRGVLKTAASEAEEKEAEAVVDAVDNLARRIEEVAARLERA